MIRAGIIGGAGYAGGELLRLLWRHPEVTLAFVHSDSQKDKPVAAVHDDLWGECDLVFTTSIDWTVDVLFLCSAHGKSKVFVETHAAEIRPELLLIDLSQDYRLDLGFVYGLPELHSKAIRKSKRIANPGCFATAIQLALLPLAKEGMLTHEVHINAITGSTGAGQSLQETTHFSWRSDNVSIYKPFGHQHLAEIGQSLTFLQPDLKAPLHFIPVRGGFTRGIFASVYTHTEADFGTLQELYDSFYEKAPFAHVIDPNPHLKQVVNTNNCYVHLEKHGDQVLIISVIDNLLKGAAGQAVQNMNLALGLEEQMGLELKAGVF